MEDDHDLKVKLDPEGHIYMYKGRITILTNINSPDRTDRPQDSLIRFLRLRQRS